MRLDGDTTMSWRAVSLWLTAVAVANLLAPVGVGLAVSAACFIRFALEYAK